MKAPDKVLNKCASVLEKLDKQRHHIMLLMKLALEEKYSCTLTHDKHRGAMKAMCKHDTRNERTEVQRTLQKDETYHTVRRYYQKVWTTKR